jgi:hypothetical protein
MLLFRLYGVKTYSVYNDPLFDKIGASETIGHEVLPDDPKALAKSDQLFFVKTHGLPKDPYPAIYIARDGRDAIVSYARYLLTFDQKRWTLRWPRKGLERWRFRKTLKGLCVGNGRPGRSWRDNVLAWVRDRRDGETFTVKYEAFLVDPANHLQAALTSLSIPLVPTAGGMPTFESLHERWPEFFRKGKVGSWREEMPRTHHELFWRHQGEAMDLLGYPR